MAMVQLYMYAILMRNRTLASDFSFMSFSFSSDFFIHEMKLSNTFKQKKNPVENFRKVVQIYKLAIYIFHGKSNEQCKNTKVLPCKKVQKNVGTDYVC